MRHTNLLLFLLMLCLWPALLARTAGPAALVPRASNLTPLWSPDGQHIAYIQAQQTERRGFHALQFYLYHVQHGAVWHRFGRRAGPVALSEVDRRMGMPELTGVDQVFAWAPDGTVFALIANNISVAAANQSLFVAGPTGLSQCLTSHDTVRSLAWSRDSQRIAFVSEVGKDTVLAVIDRNGNNRRELARGAFEGAPAWTADGKSLIVAKAGETRMTDLWVVTVADGKASNLTNTPNKPERQPAVSPDGTMLAYAGNISGVIGGMIATDVYVTPLHAFAPKKLISLSDTPRWRPDGKALAVRSSHDAHQPVRYQILDLNGAVLKTVPVEDHLAGYTTGISFAPDSKRFVYEKDGTIWLDSLE